ncbi:hypothetical protein [Zooshikella ganghwensis]|nr:hypothetical protein [Zooshikella ganghwensis]
MAKVELTESDFGSDGIFEVIQYFKNGEIQYYELLEPAFTPRWFGQP